MIDNKELLEVMKTITTGNLKTGGLLDPKRQKSYIQMVENNSTFLPLIRSMTQTQAKGILDRIMLGNPITRKAAENTLSTKKNSPVFGQVKYECEKLISDWNITYETLQNNLTGKALESQIMNMMTTKIADDIDMLSIQGDVNITGTDDVSMLLKSNDGFDKLTDECHLVYAGGANISSDVFVEALRILPEKFKKNLSRLRWFVPTNLYLDYIQVLQSRQTGLGDISLQTNKTIAPLGIPMVQIPYIPTNKPVLIGSAVPGVVISNHIHPFQVLTGENDKIALKIDGGSLITITIPQGGHQITDIMAVLNDNAALKAAALIKSDGFGRLIIESRTTGAGSSVEIVTVANSAYETLGINVGTYTGAASGASSYAYDGTFIWLTDPQNFIHVIQDQTRVYSEYNKDFDRLETVNYNQNDFVLEDNNALVKVQDLRVKS